MWTILSARKRWLSITVTLKNQSHAHAHKTEDLTVRCMDITKGEIEVYVLKTLFIINNWKTTVSIKKIICI